MTGAQTNYISGAGNFTAAEDGTAFTNTSTSWYFVDGVDVSAEARAQGAIVAFWRANRLPRSLSSAVRACAVHSTLSGDTLSYVSAALARARQVGPWPDRPRLAAREDGCAGPGVQHAFPSGRAAVLACLKLTGIGLGQVVATPECVSSCVADAVRKCARPTPLRAALAQRAGELGAAIIYEQWGWPLPMDAQDAVRERFAGVPIIVDRVDSADFLCTERTFGAFEVLSLSKVLGIDAGGIARRAGLLRYEPEGNRRPAPGADHPGLVSHPAVRELFKQSDHVHPSVLRWLAENCAHTALEAERRERSTAARLVLESPLAAGWPAWMAEAIDSGAGPVWAPVLRGKDPRPAIATLHASGIQAAVRTFNWTGNPLAPCYEPALALPIHSGVARLLRISALSRQLGMETSNGRRVQPLSGARRQGYGLPGRAL